MKNLIAFLSLATSLHAIDYTYSAFGQLLSESYPDGSHVFYEYDSVGSLTARTVLTANANPQADLAVTHSIAPTSPTAGTEATITLTITNNGPDPATDVTFNDALPAHFNATSVSSDQGAATLQDNALVVALGTLANGQTVTLQIVGTVTNDSDLLATFTANSPVESNASNNSTDLNQTVEGGIDLATNIAKGPDPSLTNVGFVPFIATVTNSGPSTATNVTHTFTLPTNLTFVFGTTGTVNSTHNAGTVTTVIPAMTAGESIDITLGVATGGAPGTATITDAIVADEVDTDLSNNGSTTSIELIASTLVVTTLNDSGAGSLRQAILDANADPGADVIRFQIPGLNIPVLDPVTQLPDITAPVFIDGFSAEASAFEIDATDLTHALAVKSSDVTLRGLSLNRAQSHGLLAQGINGAPVQRFTLLGSAIGLDGNGAIARGNGGDGIHFERVEDSRIGGPLFWQGNGISANNNDGIETDFRCERITIQGNKIGLDFSGTDRDFELENGNHGINLRADDCLIGGPNPGEENFISNNGNFGIDMLANGNVIQGNIIGLTTDNLSAGNEEGGIQADGDDNLIGGDTQEEGNIISASSFDPNIDLGEGTKVTGNFIGLNLTLDGPATTSRSLGVAMRRGAVLGGILPGERNVISGINGDGVRLDFDAGQLVTIINNYIGTDPTGTFAIPNDRGLNIEASTDTLKQIGLPVHGGGNLISGNQDDGIQLRSVFSRGVQNTVIQNNLIGTDITGENPLPNGRDGIRASNADIFDNLIGGTTALTGNTIAFNDNEGIDLSAGDRAGNSILGNSIHSNGRLGISLLNDTPLPNDDGDADDGDNDTLANDGQNHPIVTIAETTGSIMATLNSTPSETFRIEFFANQVCDPSGNGEGRTFLGFAELTTEADGNGSVTFNTDPVTAGTFITATATNSEGSTSEFGPCITVVAPTNFADEDGDGMSDDFELEHFGSTTGGDPDADSDGDGETNRQEFIALTDPNNPNSRFSANLEPDGTGIVIQVRSELGRTYSLETSNTLTENSFNTVGNSQEGTGGVIEFRDNSAEPNRFYRIEVKLTAN